MFVIFHRFYLYGVSIKTRQRWQAVVSTGTD